MRTTLCLLALLCHLAAFAADNIQVYFSPGGGCTAAIVQALNSAKRTVHLQAYSFTSKPIAKALLDAHKRGVRISILLDDSNQTDEYSAATFLQNQGLSPFIDAEHAIAHNKIMVIDAQTVITGSFNFSKAAEEKNAENVLVIRDAALAGRYLENFHKHAKHSRPYQRKVR